MYVKLSNDPKGSLWITIVPFLMQQQPKKLINLETPAFLK